MPPVVRSIGAVVLGFVLIGALSFGTDYAISQFIPGFLDPGTQITSVPLLLGTMAYVAVYAVFGCYVTARLAPSRPMLHALVLGALGLAFNVMGTIAMWSTAPAWYHTASLLLVMPYAYLGGRIRERELEAATPAMAVA